MKFFLIITGTISLILGIIGIIVPILPTTPFLLLSANLYLHSSPRLHQKLVNSKYIGTYIKNYKNGKGIPVKSKVFMISLLWLSLGYSIFVPL
ncbi:MAG: YbaN family protein, partial [Rikenellaceae bacterium]